MLKRLRASWAAWLLLAGGLCGALTDQAAAQQDARPSEEIILQEIIDINVTMDRAIADYGVLKQATKNQLECQAALADYEKNPTFENAVMAQALTARVLAEKQQQLTEFLDNERDVLAALESNRRERQSDTKATEAKRDMVREDQGILNGERNDLNDKSHQILEMIDARRATSISREDTELLKKVVKRRRQLDDQIRNAKQSEEAAAYDLEDLELERQEFALLETHVRGLFQDARASYSAIQKKAQLTQEELASLERQANSDLRRNWLTKVQAGLGQDGQVQLPKSTSSRSRESLDVRRQGLEKRNQTDVESVLKALRESLREETTDESENTGR